MQSNQRAIVAGIAAAMVNSRSYGSVYDYSRGTHVSVSIKVSGDRVDAYDYSRGAHVSGNLPSSLYDYGYSRHLELKKNGRKVSGYDWNSSRHFEITVQGSSVSFYDYDGSGYHNFSV